MPTGFSGWRIATLLAIALSLPGVAAGDEFAIVLGSFSTVESAELARSSLERDAGETLRIRTVHRSGLPLYRVTTPPLTDEGSARGRLARLRRSGFADAWLERDLAAGTEQTLGQDTQPRFESVQPPPGSTGPPAPMEPSVTEEVVERPAEPAESGVADVAPALDAELLAGFDDDIEVRSSADQQPSWIELDGQLALSGSYTFDAARGSQASYDGLSKLQALLRVRTDLQWRSWRMRLEAKSFRDFFYAIEGRDQFSSRVLDRHEQETEWHEVYLQGDLGSHWNLKTGRQIEIWGRSDNLRVLDRLNPIDLREPGSADIEDLRLPVNMTRIRYHRGFLTLDGVAVHEIRFNKLPAPGSEFLPLPLIPPREETPRDDLLAEHAFAVTAVFPGWDLSLHHARMFDDDGDLVVEEGVPTLRHSRLVLNGLAFNRTFGSWLMRGELAEIGNQRLSGHPGDSFDRLDFLLGLEYAGWRDTSIAVETSVQRLRGWRPAIHGAETDDELWQSAFRLSRTFLNERLRLLLVALLQGRQLDEGHILRASLEYSLQDDISAFLGVVFYGDGDRPPLDRLGDRDRILFGIKIHF